MTSVIIWFAKQTPLVKLLLIIILVGSVYGSVISVQKGVYKYKYFKQVEKQYETAKDSITALNIRLKENTKTLKKRTENVQKKSKSINEKLKSDEATIDNRDISNDELDKFLSEYDND